MAEQARPEPNGRWYGPQHVSDLFERVTATEQRLDVLEARLSHLEAARDAAPQADQ
jgi:ubiquinone biosynthesis protein UbiJ